jgi:hypothetical protein
LVNCLVSEVAVSRRAHKNKDRAHRGTKLSWSAEYLRKRKDQLKGRLLF